VLRLVAGRLLQAIATLLLASVLVFLLGRASGNPADLVLPQDATPAMRAAYIARMGLDRPLPVQYASFIGGALRGDFGTSLRTGRPATEIVFARLPRTMALGTAGILVAIVISLPLGVLAAVQRGRLGDRIGSGFALLGQSVPSFWLGIILILVFAVWLRWLPTSGVGTWQHFVLPSIVLGVGLSAGIVRLLRSSMLDVLGSEFVKFARTKGVPERGVIWKHALRNALLPVITFIGFMYGIVIASALVVEVVFGWPGLGSLAYESTLWRDFPVLQLTVLVYTTLIVAINFLVDLSYGLIDPRVRA
jgi:peptide/nickel transport system permease protein